MEDSANHTKRMIMSAIAGSIGSAVSVVIGQPFDIVKIRLQYQPYVDPLYQSPLRCIQAIFYNEGPIAFFRGTSAPLSIAALLTGVRIIINENCKKGIRKYNKYMGYKHPSNLSTSQISLCGSAAGF